MAPTGTTAQTTLELVLLRAALALLGTLRRPTQEPFQQALVPLVQQHVGSNLVIVGIFPFVGQQIISACYSSSDFDFSITLTNFDNIKNLQV